MMEIRISKIEEKYQILNFIKEYWQKDHIFLKWEELFDDYYIFQDELHFVIAKKDDTIFGVCGFIYANRNSRPDVWLALWKVIPSGIPSLGLDMIKFLHSELQCNILSCCGIKKEVKRLYEFMGYMVGTLNHYYRLNDEVNSKIAIIKENVNMPYVSLDEDIILINNVNEFEKLILKNFDFIEVSRPYKDINYLTKKYFKNLAYNYQCWFISKTNKHNVGFIFTKMIELNQSRVLRIVDFVGDEDSLRYVGGTIDSLMRKNKCEYVDFYEFGLKDSTLTAMGMIKKDFEGETIIPNYFEPYEQKNVEIHFFTNNLSDFRVFKADGDQERPNKKIER